MREAKIKTDYEPLYAQYVKRQDELTAGRKLKGEICRMKLVDRWAVAELEVKFTPVNKTGVIIHNSEDAYHVMLEMWDKTMINMQEQFAALFCNRANEVIGYRVIGTGSAVATTVGVKELAGMALACQATMVIIAHNHPSGTLRPSTEDEKFTQTIKQALNLLDICLSDHLIITESLYYSFADEDKL